MGRKPWGWGFGTGKSDFSSAYLAEDD